MIMILFILLNYLRTNKLKLASTIILIMTIILISHTYIIGKLDTSRYKYAFDKNYTKNDIRVESARSAIDVSWENGFMPYGIGNVYERVFESERYYSELFYFNRNLIEKNGKILIIQPHNIYEWILVEYGIVYLFIFVALLLSWIVKNLRLINKKDLFKNYLLFSVMVSSIFFFDPFLIHNTKLSIIFVIILCCNLIDVKKVKALQAKSSRKIRCVSLEYDRRKHR